jgi:hypothetical protein
MSVIAPCHVHLALLLTIVGKDGHAFQRHEIAVVCGQAEYAASFIVPNRNILLNR